MNTSKSLNELVDWILTAPSYTKYELKAAIVEAVEGLIDREPESYRKYLVVRHKLGLEENQAQAKLIAKVIDNYKAELLEAIKEWQDGR